MTVVLALRCADGLVLATDSQAIARMPGGIPVRMDTTKIVQVGDFIVFAGTGSVGLGQRIKQELDNNLKNLSKKLPRQTLATEIHRLVNPIQKAAQTSFVEAPGTEMDVWGGLFCGLASDGPYLMEIDLNGGWQFHDQPPFASTGSGHAFAHLAISSVIHHDVVNQPLVIAQLLAYRTIENVCLASAFGVHLPVQMAVLTRDGITMSSKEVIEELNETVNLWKIQEKETLGALAPSTPPVKDAHAEKIEQEDGLERPV